MLVSSAAGTAAQMRSSTVATVSVFVFVFVFVSADVRPQ
jgi:hypothetical protein